MATGARAGEMEMSAMARKKASQPVGGLDEAECGTVVLIVSRLKVSEERFAAVRELTSTSFMMSSRSLHTCHLTAKKIRGQFVSFLEKVAPICRKLALGVCLTLPRFDPGSWTFCLSSKKPFRMFKCGAGWALPT